ncbi:MAG: hypothetical protein EP329_07195 [Deltaproteobacteria bacterium]|nr:MAG: hypothetical protein EP329_07195 [Deltaproteobacteria bacterium]
MRWFWLCGVTLAIVSFGAPAAHAGEPDHGDERSDEDRGDDGAGDDGGSTVEIAPVETDPDTGNLDLDGVEPAPEKTLPPDGMAHRPNLPSVDRDMLNPRQGGAGRGSATLEISKIGEDTFVDLDFVYVFKPGKWRIAPQLPIRLRILDEHPEDDGLIRNQDWDEVSDWARLLAFVQYGSYDDPFFFRYGQLNGVTIGHGSLVNRYFNTVDVDHYQGGLFTNFDLGFGGGEVMLDNVFDPEILVGRAFVRPFSLFDSWPRALRMIKLGATLGGDFTAPLSVSTADGAFYAHPDWHPVVLADQIVTLFSTDIEVPAVSTAHLDVVPYMDFATVDGEGFGWHLGTYVNVRFTPESVLHTRLEYRFQGKGYEPGYVSAFYEIQRYSHLGGDPKLAQLLDGEIGKRHDGFYFEGDLRIADAFRFTVLYSTRGGKRGNDLMARLRLRDIGPVSVTLFLGRVGFDGLDNLFAADRTVWGTSVRLNLTDWLFIRGSMVNEWWVKHRPEDGTGYFETDTNFSFGAGLMVRL